MINTDRLRQLAHCAADGKWSEFHMSIPARPDHDADLVLSAAADEIDRLRAEIAALKDPAVVLVNMMRGQIATPSPAALAGLFSANLTDLELANLRIAELSESLQFVERWAVHHAGKRYHDGSPIHRAEDVLRTIAAHPSISEITKRMSIPFVG